MWLPEKFAWPKERPLAIRSRQNMTDLARVAEREVSAYCREHLPEEYPHGCHLCTTIAWNANSEDGLSPPDLVGDNFADGDTLFVYANMYRKDEHGGCDGHDHGSGHSTAHGGGHGGADSDEFDNCDCGYDHGSGHAGGGGHGNGH